MTDVEENEGPCESMFVNAKNEGRFRERERERTEGRREWRECESLGCPMFVCQPSRPELGNEEGFANKGGVLALQVVLVESVMVERCEEWGACLLYRCGFRAP